MTSRSVSIVNELGVHARAAAKFVHLATRFESSIKVSRDNREMDGKSILGILLLAAARGTTLLITANGTDEQQALEALVALVEAGFGEGICDV
jgi:phosphocarrier protein HPr